jgi:RNA polymerase sigma factor (sigma-70 family)
MTAHPITIPLERARSQGFEEFFAEVYEPLLRAVYLVTGDRFEAEDLAQEAFFRVYQRWDRIGRLANPAGYAYRVAINAYHSRFRRLAVVGRRAFRREARDELSVADDRDSIRRAMARLPRAQREGATLRSLGSSTPGRYFVGYGREELGWTGLSFLNIYTVDASGRSLAPPGYNNESDLDDPDSSGPFRLILAGCEHGTCPGATITIERLLRRDRTGIWTVTKVEDRTTVVEATPSSSPGY